MSTEKKELNQLLDFAVEIAQEAGEITLRHFRGSFIAERKADNSFVTVADREAEAHLRARIETAFPEDSILGEEEGETSGTSNRRWILDPIDGTYSFVHGVPLYSVLIGVEITGEPIVGVVTFRPWKIVYAARGWVASGTVNQHVSSTIDRRSPCCTDLVFEQYGFGPPALYATGACATPGAATAMYWWPPVARTSCSIR